MLKAVNIGNGVNYMSREEALGYLKAYKDLFAQTFGTDFRKALNIAIEALEREAYGDGE